MKTEKGVQSKEQKAIEQIIKKCGAEYHVVRSIDDVVRVLSL